MLVNHIVIGVGRSGTTSLVAYLQQHPQINCSNIKEVTYFSVDDHYQRGESFLHSFFTPKETTKINSTSDTYLFIDEVAAKRIFEYNPNIKLTVILRDPGKRAFSNYNYSVNNGYYEQPISFLDTLKEEQEVLKNRNIVDQNNYGHFYGSLYHQHLTHWLKYFSKEQLFICTTNELHDNPQKLMKRLFQFLELDDIEVQELSEQNQAAGVKNKGLNRFLVDRDHPLRKLIRKPLQIPFLRKLVLSSDVVGKVKNINKAESTNISMTDSEEAFCKNYFKEDLQKLKTDFGITFD